MGLVNVEESASYASLLTERLNTNVTEPGSHGKLIQRSIALQIM